MVSTSSTQVNLPAIAIQIIIRVCSNPVGPTPQNWGPGGKRQPARAAAPRRLGHEGDTGQVSQGVTVEAVTAKSRMRDCWFRIEDGGSGEDGGEGAQDEGEVAEQGAPGKEGRSRARSRASLAGRTRVR